MRPRPSRPPDWPRDGVDDSAQQHASSPLGRASQPSPAAAVASSSPPLLPAAAPASPREPREAPNAAPRLASSAAPSSPVARPARPARHGLVACRDEPLHPARLDHARGNQVRGRGCRADSFLSTAASLVSDDPDVHLDPADHPLADPDLDMSDSDGGAPLHDHVVTTALLASPDSSDLHPSFDPSPHLPDAASWPASDDDDGGDDDDDDDDDDDENNNDQPPVAYPALHQHDQHLFSLDLHTQQDVAALIMDEAFSVLPWATGLPTSLLPGDTPSPDPFQAFPSHPPLPLDFIDTLPPLQASNPNPAILGSENLGLVDFLRDWAQQSCFSSATRPRPPHLRHLLEPAGANADSVAYRDLRGEHCDFQGLDWASMQTTREDARIRRRRTYKNYVNRAGSDKCRPRDYRITSRDGFFRFRAMTFRPDVSLAHFQLRSVLACPSRTRAYYSSPGGITRMNLASKDTSLVLNLREFPDMGGVISTLDAAHGILMGGTFNGDYCIQSLDSEEGKAFSEGQISPDGITNHLSIHTPRRSARPVASIASNDRGFRVLDIETEKLVSQTMYGFALNCSASSPDQRLRVLVGDNPTAIIINADTGETLQELAGHQDYGFACDWSDDGWTVATGFQDKAVKIWDARRWCNSSGVSAPLCTIRSEMAGVRGLRFSPLGSGPPILAAAEEADFVNLIDAQTFASKQTIDVFSEIGGLAFANEGQDLNVLCCDTHRGGLLQLERCGGGLKLVPGRAWRASRPWLDEGGQDGLWPDEWSRKRRPTLLEGPQPF